MENYNRQLRNLLDKFITNCLNQGFSLRESVINYSHILYKLEITEDPFENLYREYIISVMYIDAYKLYLYRQNNVLLRKKKRIS